MSVSSKLRVWILRVRASESAFSSEESLRSLNLLPLHWSSCQCRSWLDYSSERTDSGQDFAYSIFRLLSLSSCRHMDRTSRHSSKRFRLKSSSTILGQVVRISSAQSRGISELTPAGLTFREDSCAMQSPSSITIRSSWRLASCFRILSNPTSSTSLPLILMDCSSCFCAGVKAAVEPSIGSLASSSSSEAYFCRSASMNSLG